MSIEEARKIMWLRSNYRSLGELFDEGYLNRTRLEWAAAKAYDTKLRQGARVLLNQLAQPFKNVIRENAPTPSPQPKNTLLEIDISLDHARTTAWPFAPYKGQLMGPLAETRQISLKDLGYAIENAWDERVRRAAIALSLVRMQQAVTEPPSPAGFLHVVAGGRSYAERQQFRITLLEGTVFGAAIAVGVVLSIDSFIRQSPTQPSKSLSILLASPSGLAALAIALALIIGAVCLILYFFNRVIDGFDKQIRNYRLGQEGEDRVTEVVRQSLDGNWYLFRNVVLPGRNKGDLDAVVVGPSGVWVLEIKSFSGEYRDIRGQWQYRKGKRWKSLTSNPSRQAEGNAIRLSNFLKADGISQWVTAAVVWANGGSALTVENPATAVWPLERLPDELGNLWRGQPISVATKETIVRKLTQLCDAQAKKYA